MLPIEPSPDTPSSSDQSSTDTVSSHISMSDLSEGHVLIVQDDRGRHRFVLDDEIYSIGRDHDCDIRLFSQFVSRHHATLMRVQDNEGHDIYRIVDGNLKGKVSSNGLLINGQKHQSYELQNEEEIVFGPQVKAVYYRVRQDQVE